MDILDFDTSGGEGVKMQVRHPVSGAGLVTQNEKPVTLTLVSVDSGQYQSAVNRQINQRLKAAASAKLAQPSAEDLLRENIELLVSATMGWEGIEFNGEDFPFSADNARAAYSKLPWLRMQVKEFIEDRANFLKASAAI